MARPLALALAAPLAAATAGQESFFLGGTTAPLTLLPQVDEQSAACLDGSPYGFYFVPSASKSTKWTIWLQGGGWCYNEKDCLARSKMHLGTSKAFPKQAGCECMNVKEDGTIDDCNCLFMPYGDGASFSGFRPKPWKVGNSSLYFRGIKNFDQSLDWAFAHGLDKATEFVLTGSSAGGLSTFLHADRAAERLAKQAPACKMVRAAPIVGYFLDHDNFQRGDQNYTAWMKYIYHMQNLTFGSDGALAPACQAAFPNDPHYCFMSPHMQRFIQTPFFMFNSKYDEWQLQNELQLQPSQWKTPQQQAAVLQYGADFMAQLEAVPREGKHGGMITSCVCHGCPWSSLTLEGKSSYQHYADWFYGKVKGPAALHIDPRKPNGDGTIKLGSCARFPSAAEELLVV